MALTGDTHKPVAHSSRARDAGVTNAPQQVFDTVEVLTKGGPTKATEVLLYTMYTEGFNFFRTAYACAVTVVFLAIVVGLTLLQARLADRRVHYA